jgi:hypothetical protein
VNPAPVAAADEIVTATPPVFVIVTGTIGLLPIITFPNATLAGEAAISPLATPEPDKVSTEVEGSLLSFFHQLSVTSETSPLSVSAEGGVNVTLKDILCPARRSTGQEIPLIVYPLPLTLA